MIDNFILLTKCPVSTLSSISLLTTVANFYSGHSLSINSLSAVITHKTISAILKKWHLVCDLETICSHTDWLALSGVNTANTKRNEHVMKTMIWRNNYVVITVWIAGKLPATTAMTLLADYVYDVGSQWVKTSKTVWQPFDGLIRHLSL